MKTKFKFYNSVKFPAIIAAFMLLASCQEVIDIELRDSDRKIVIEGAVYEGVDSVIVKVTKTTSFFDTSEPQGLDNADVKLIMPGGDIVDLISQGNGNYKATGLDIITDADYGLIVEADGQEFTATTHMMPSLPLDSLSYEFEEGFFGGDDGYNVFLNYQDEPGKNFYRIVTIVNDTLLNEPSDIQVVDDNLNDGNYIRIPIFTHFFAAGDSVDTELQSIDADLYDFYQTWSGVVSEDAGSPFSAAPANPQTNIQGGALGIFGAYTRSRLSIRIPG